MNRRNLILTGILVIQLVVAAVVLWPRQTSSQAGQALFPGLEAAQVVSLAISGPDGESIRLAKRTGGWVLPDAGDYPCQDENVTALLNEIVGLTADRLVTQTSSSHKRLKVSADDFERRIEFELTDGTEHWLYVGSSPTFGATHVRVADQNQVYLTSELTAQDANLQTSGWVDRIYFSVSRDDVVALSLENANGRFQFTRLGETWMMAELAAGESFNESSIQTLLSRATSVALQTPLGKEAQPGYGIEQPLARVTLTTRDGSGVESSQELLVGAQDPGDKSYIITSSESPFFVRVSEFSVRDFVEKGREDFLNLPPTPTPVPTVEATPEVLVTPTP